MAFIKALECLFQHIANCKVKSKPPSPLLQVMRLKVQVDSFTVAAHKNQFYDSYTLHVFLALFLFYQLSPNFWASQFSSVTCLSLHLKHHHKVYFWAQGSFVEAVSQDWRLQARQAWLDTGEDLTNWLTTVSVQASTRTPNKEGIDSCKPIHRQCAQTIN